MQNVDIICWYYTKYGLITASRSSKTNLINIYMFSVINNNTKKDVTYIQSLLTLNTFHVFF